MIRFGVCEIYVCLFVHKILYLHSNANYVCHSFWLSVFCFFGPATCTYDMYYGIKMKNYNISNLINYSIYSVVYFSVAVVVTGRLIVSILTGFLLINILFDRFRKKLLRMSTCFCFRSTFFLLTFCIRLLFSALNIFSNRFITFLFHIDKSYRVYRFCACHTC